MKKIMKIMAVLVLMAVAFTTGAVWAQDHAKAKERELMRYNRNVRNDLVLSNYEWGDFAIDSFNDGYTVTIRYFRNPEDILNGTVCELGNVNDDTLAEFISEHPGYRVIKVEREMYSEGLYNYRNVEV